jgi:hypothetical protein
MSIFRYWFLGCALTCSFFLVGCSEVAYKKITSVKTGVDQETRITAGASINKQQTVITRMRSPEEILKQTIYSVEQLIGKPGFRRNEGDAIVFQYSQDWCIFDVVFYGKGEAKTASYYEFRTTDGRDLNIIECLHKVITGQSKK